MVKQKIEIKHKSGESISIIVEGSNESYVKYISQKIEKLFMPTNATEEMFKSVEEMFEKTFKDLDNKFKDMNKNFDELNKSFDHFDKK